DAATAVKGTTITANAAHGVLANDSDPDSNTLKVTAVSFGNNNVAVTTSTPAVINGQYGTLTINWDGSYNYVAKQNVENNSQHLFSDTVSDGNGGNASSFLNVDITSAQGGKPSSQPAQPYSQVVAIWVWFQDPDQQLGTWTLYKGSGVLIGPNEI